MRSITSFLLASAVAASTLLGVASPARAAGVSPSLFADLHWRLIGPFRGGRALAVTGVPGEPNHFYFGSVNGGVWESRNAGRTWLPIFDRESIASIGAIAVAPSDPKTLYVGTGEADMRSDIASGIGMFKSSDGGATWTHIGLDDTRQIGRIVVDPRDASVAYVAALGHQYGPNAQRGVFKTTDGGKSWSKVLYKDENTGAIDLSMDPKDPQTVFASLWQTRRPPWNVYPPSNGPGSGLYVTHDGGASWTHLTQGLPAKVGHIGISVSGANSKRVYAAVDSDIDHGGVYRSDDGGATWTFGAGKSAQVRIWKRGWYFSKITADPKDADTVYVTNTSTYRSTDGAKSFTAIKGAPGGDDYQGLWIDPNDANRMILGSDQGVVVSVDRAATWSSWYNQPTGQFYHIAVDDRFPYWVYGAQQDSGAIAVPSRSKRAGISMHDWQAIDVGGEDGFIAPDPRKPGSLFGGSDTQTVEQLDSGSEQVVDATTAHPGTIWRHTWTLPLVFSPADHRSLYTTHQDVFRSRDFGKTWQIISPDLTRPNPGVPPNLDKVTADDNTGLVRRGVVYALAPSPLDAKVLWAGTDDGLIWVTTDDGKHWHNVTPSQVTSWSKVGILEASHTNRNVAYAAVDRHRLDDLTPYIYRTRDGGAHWTPIADGIPKGAFVNVVREDPARPGLLYAGTELGMYVSFDDGDHWQTLQLNLPTTSIRDIAIHNGDVAIATHGRAFWILDDVTLLRQIAAGSAAERAHLFAPRIAYRIRPGSDEGTPLAIDEPSAKNPPDGAVFDYYLRDAATTPVVLTVIDGSGHTASHWSSADRPKLQDPSKLDVPAFWVSPPAVPSADPGHHRFIWDLQYDNDNGPLAPPGRYTVRLSANGTTYEQSFTVSRDPRVNASDADLRAQFALAQTLAARKTSVEALKTRAEALLKRAALPAGQAQILRRDIIGGTAPSDPDDSVGKPSHDFTSFTYLGGAYDALGQIVESADAPPTADARTALARLDAILAATTSRLNAIEQMH